MASMTYACKVCPTKLLAPYQTPYLVIVALGILITSFKGFFVKLEHTMLSKKYDIIYKV